MKRLTERDEDGFVYTGIDTNCVNGCYDIWDKKWLDDALDRLAAIEDILGDEYELDRFRELAQTDKEGRVVILPFKTPGWGWSCRKGYPTAVEAYYPFPSSVMREIETGRYVGKTKEEAEDIFLKKMLRTEKE